MSDNTHNATIYCFHFDRIARGSLCVSPISPKSSAESPPFLDWHCGLLLAGYVLHNAAAQHLVFERPCALDQCSSGKMNWHVLFISTKYFHILLRKITIVIKNLASEQPLLCHEWGSNITLLRHIRWWRYVYYNLISIIALCPPCNHSTWCSRKSQHMGQC